MLYARESVEGRNSLSIRMLILWNGLHLHIYRDPHPLLWEARSWWKGQGASGQQSQDITSITTGEDIAKASISLRKHTKIAAQSFNHPVHFSSLGSRILGLPRLPAHSKTCSHEVFLGMCSVGPAWQEAQDRRSYFLSLLVECWRRQLARKSTPPPRTYLAEWKRERKDRNTDEHT